MEKSMIGKALAELLESVKMAEDALDCIMEAQNNYKAEEDSEKITTDQVPFGNDSVKALSQTVFKMKCLLRFQHENVMELKELLEKI